LAKNIRHAVEDGLLLCHQFIQLNKHHATTIRGAVAVIVQEMLILHDPGYILTIKGRTAVALPPIIRSASLMIVLLS
jgi:hypothetical protein